MEKEAIEELLQIMEDRAMLYPTECEKIRVKLRIKP